MMIPRAREIGQPLMNLVRVKSLPILSQLHLEERLLRTSADNWCIVNNGTDKPTIVMGISGKLSELVELEPVICDQIPVVRRFSGGGTVIVDDKTIFVTFICNKDAVPGVQPYPRPIMSWTGQLYGDAFRGFADFHLRENDYAFDTRKFGGNAQSITKNRWIHHTSFLWDYDVKNMEYLKLPMKAPKYRSEKAVNISVFMVIEFSGNTATNLEDITAACYECGPNFIQDKDLHMQSPSTWQVD